MVGVDEDGVAPDITVRMDPTDPTVRTVRILHMDTDMGMVLDGSLPCSQPPH